MGLFWSGPHRVGRHAVVQAGLVDQLYRPPYSIDHKGLEAGISRTQLEGPLSGYCPNFAKFTICALPTSVTIVENSIVKPRPRADPLIRSAAVGPQRTAPLQQRALRLVELLDDPVRSVRISYQPSHHIFSFNPMRPSAKNREESAPISASPPMTPTFPQHP